MAKHVHSANEFDNELNAAGNKLVVVDFHAAWCGPCKVIAPVFESLAKQTPGAVFLKVDVDAVQAVAQRYSVRAMPTFLFLKNRSVIETLQGANSPHLTALVKQHATGESSSAFSGSGQTLGGASSSGSRSPGSIPGVTEGHYSLLDQIDFTQTWALGLNSDDTIKHVVEDRKNIEWLETEDDEQMIIHLGFKQEVKISSLILRTRPYSIDSSPRRVKLFVNRTSLSFEDAENEESAQELELTEEEVQGDGKGGGGKVVPLRFVKFQKISSITIAVLTNQGDAYRTRIDSFDVFGLANQAINMHALRSIKTQSLLPSRTGLKGGSSRRSSLPPTSPTSPLTPSSSRPSMDPSRSYTSSIDTSYSQDGTKPKLRRRSSSFADSETGSVPASPPFISNEKEEDFEATHTTSEGLGGWHYAPLIIALAPPIGAVIGGKADVWSDAILVLIASFWLYQFLRVPWEIYYSARTRRVLSHDQAKATQQDEDVDTSTETAGQEAKETEEQLLEEAEKERSRQAAMAELQRSELMALLFCVLSPLIGAYLLGWMRETMLDGGRYINSLNLRLFTLTAGIKPWSHAVKLVRRRMIHLQEEVHYPSSKVEDLTKKLRRMEAELSSIRTMIATKNDIRILRDVDAQLGRAFRRTERKEEHLRLSAEDKFNEVESRLEDLLREVAINAELIEEERRERERAASLRISLFEAVKYLLGSGLTVRRSGHKHYLHDASRVIPSAASLGIGGSVSPTNEQPSPYYPVSNGARYQPQQQPLSPGTRPPGNGKPAPRTSSPPLDSHMISRYYERNGMSQVSDPWWERGLAFYLFLPLNVSSAAIRFAGEKVRSIIVEDGDDPTLKKQRKFQQHITDPQAKIRAYPKLVKQVGGGRRGRSE